MKYERTSRFLGKRYLRNNSAGHTLKIGDVCMVHPTATSQMRKPYEVTIIEKEINWVGPPSVEICAHKDGGHSAVMNDYLFARLEPI